MENEENDEPGIWKVQPILKDVPYSLWGKCESPLSVTYLVKTLTDFLNQTKTPLILPSRATTWLPVGAQARQTARKIRPLYS